MTSKDGKSEPNLTKTAFSERHVARAEIDRDSLKAIFHFLVGKPDSTIQVFGGPFELTKSDVASLDDLISRKLRNHHIETVNSCAYLSSSDRTIREFGTIQDLLNHSSSGPEQTEDVTLKWDFLVNIATYEMPQRHTLTVRVGKSPNPKDMIRRLFSQSEDAPDDPHDLAMAPMYCRADFVSPILGKELLNIVKDWHQGLKRPMGVSPMVLKIRKYGDALSKTIEYSIPFTVGLCCVAIFEYLLSKYSPTATVTISVLEETAISFAASLAAIYVATIGARALASISSANLRGVDVNSVAFSLTNGDYNLNQRTIDRSNRKFRYFLFSSGWAIVINLLATYLAFHLGIGAVL